MSDDAPREPAITVSMSRKINLGNYESAEFFVAITGAKAGMTDEDLAPLVGVGKLAWDQIREVLIQEIRRTRDNGHG